MATTLGQVRTAPLEAKAALLVALASLLAIAWGSYATGLFQQALWTSRGASLRTAFVLAVALAFASWSTRRSPAGYSRIVVAAMLLLAAVFAGVAATATLCLLLLSAHALGRRAFADDANRVGPLLTAIVQVATGFALIAGAVFALSFTRWNSPALYLPLLLLPIALGWRDNLDAWRQLRYDWSEPATLVDPAWVRPAFVLVGFSLLMRLLAALHPEVGTDALAMHLVVGDQLRATGTFHYDVTRSIWAVMPLASDWLLGSAQLLSGESGARLLNFAIDALLVAGVIQAATRIRGRAAGAIAGLVYSTLPLLYRESSTLYADNAWTLWATAALVPAWLSLHAGRTRDVFVAGILIGTAFAAKLFTVFFFLVYFLPLAIAWFRTDPGRAPRKLLLAVLVVSAFGAGPYANAWVRTGNPVFPFLNQVFASPFFETGSNFGNGNFESPLGWRLPFELVFNSGKFLEGRAGAMGVAYFLAFFAALVGVVRESWTLRWAMLGALAYLLLVMQFQAYLRYLLPALPVLAVVIGSVLARLCAQSTALRRVMVATLLAGGAASLYLTPSATWQYTDLRFPPMHGTAAAREYRHRANPATAASDLLDVLGARRVLWFGDAAYAGTDAEVYATDWHGWSTRKQVLRLADARAVARWVGHNKLDTVVVSTPPGAAFTPAMQAFVDEYTDEVAPANGMAVHRVRTEVLFSHELLDNPGFEDGSKGWSGEAGLAPQGGAVLVSAERPLSQFVPVHAGSRYLLEVRAACGPEPAPYRLQVNWMSSKHGFLRADIEVVSCEAAIDKRSTLLTAPEGADGAVVYASGHDPKKTVAVDEVSFRE